MTNLEMRIGEYAERVSKRVEALEPEAHCKWCGRPNVVRVSLLKRTGKTRARYHSVVRFNEDGSRHSCRYYKDGKMLEEPRTDIDSNGRAVRQ